MHRFQSSPDPSLRPFVHSYWGLARDLSHTGGFTVTPDRFLELIFFADPPLARDATGEARLPPCTLIGLLTQPLRLVHPGMVRCASVRLHAWSAGMILPVAGALPGRQWSDASTRFAPWLPAVTGALRRGEWAQITPLFDAAVRRAFSSPPPASALSAARAFAVPPCGTGEARVTQEVATRQGRSRRQIERQVRAVTGVSPKQLSSLARFEFVRDRLWAKPGLELAALAFEAGYADQAHLTRHFRRYAGQTPSHFLRDCARLRQSLRAEDVAFLQD